MSKNILTNLVASNLLTGIHAARRDEQATADLTSQESKEGWLRSESVQRPEGPCLRIGNHAEDHSRTIVRTQEPYRTTEEGEVKFEFLEFKITEFLT